VKRVRVKDQRERRAGFLAMMVAAFEPAIRAGEHHLWHGALITFVALGRGTAED
jgi:hypothetical protein